MRTFYCYIASSRGDHPLYGSYIGNVVRSGNYGFSKRKMIKKYRDDDYVRFIAKVTGRFSTKMFDGATALVGINGKLSKDSIIRALDAYRCDSWIGRGYCPWLSRGTIKYYVEIKSETVKEFDRDNT